MIEGAIVDGGERGGEGELDKGGTGIRLRGPGPRRQSGEKHMSVLLRIMT